MAPTAINPPNAIPTPTPTSKAPVLEGAGTFTQRFADLKRRIVSKEDEESVIKSWNELLVELDKSTKEFIEVGTSLIPQVEFSEIHNLSPEKIAELRRRGSFLVKNVIPDEQALKWKEMLREYIVANPSVVGWPEPKQFFEIYWSKSQLQARSHPNIHVISKFLNSLWHSNGKATVPFSLSTPLSIGDRLRLRQPSDVLWQRHPPHVDTGGIERWEDDGLRSCFTGILKGNWKAHDPYDVDGRLIAKTDLYDRPNQSTIFRTFQGWLAMSDTGPHEGTLEVFPDVYLSNSYILLRPFFRQVENPTPNPFDASNWVFDPTYPEFPGIEPLGNWFSGIRPTPETHPHLRVPQSMVSVPKVSPGDMIFWHTDLIHAVEFEHRGKNDSSVLYIQAVPLTVQNMKYNVRQREHFFRGLSSPDFPKGVGEGAYIGKGTVDDVHDGWGKAAFALEPFGEEELDKEDPREREAVIIANELITGPAPEILI